MWLAYLYVAYFGVLFVGAFLCSHEAEASCALAVAVTAAHFLAGFAALVNDAARGRDWRTRFKERYGCKITTAADVLIVAALATGAVGITAPGEAIAIVAVALAAVGNTLCVVDQIRTHAAAARFNEVYAMQGLA